MTEAGRIHGTGLRLLYAYCFALAFASPPLLALWLEGWGPEAGQVMIVLAMLASVVGPFLAGMHPSSRRASVARMALVCACIASLAFAWSLIAQWVADVEYRAEPVILLFVLGSVAGLFVLDLRDAPYTAAARLALAIPLFFASAIVAGFLGLRGSEILVVFLGVGPGLAAVGSGPYRPGRCSWTIEILACGVGAVAWAWALHRLFLLASGLTFSTPFPVPDPRSHWEFLYTAGSTSMGIVALATLPMVAFSAVRLHRILGYRATSALVVAAVGVALLGWSYRFLAFLLLLALVTYNVLSSRPASRRALGWLGAGLLALSIQPVDMSFRSRPSGPGFAPVVIGTLTGEGVRRASRNEIVALGCSALYNAPRWVWVW